MATLNVPLLIEPKETQALWGGDALVTRYGKNGDPSAKLGESWECWDENRVSGGPFDGTTIAALRAQHGSDLLGDIDATQIFPILTKIIDARDSLSVQVHPDDAYAQAHEGQRNGKTECWYILDCVEGAELVLGWSKDAGREEYERRVADGSLGDILRRVPVAPGQAFYLPAGTLHAIGAGIVIFETQQASDLTYRIFDWNRVGADGKARELHVGKAADVLDYRRGTRGAVTTLDYTAETLHRTALIADRRFFVERVHAGAEPASLPTNGRPVIIMSLGRGLAIAANGERVELHPYQTVLVPAAAQWYELSSGAERPACMVVTPPHSAEEIAARLLAGGAPQRDIDAFMEQFAA